MLEVYWGFLAGGILFALVTVLFGDVVSHLLDGLLDFLSADFLEPMVVVGGITAFGGAGVLLTQYTALGAWPVALLSFLIAVLLATAVYFGYVKPMRNSENSTAYSIRDLIGTIGEVTVPIPAAGYGEVLIRAGAGNTNQIAASFDRTDIQAGARVVVIEVKEDTIYVSRFD